MVLELLDNMLVRIVLTLVGALVIGEIIPRLFYKLDQKSDRINLSDGTHTAFRKIFSFLVWLVALGLVIQWSGYSTHVLDVLTGESLQDRVIQIILTWAVIGIFVRYISGAFKQFDDLVGEVDLSTHTHQLVQKALNYTAYTIGLVLTFNILGWSAGFAALLTGAGVAGIVIGFAAKDVFSNLLSGIFIIMDRQFKVGDFIEVQGTSVKGIVRELSLRTTSIDTLDNIRMHIPNQLMATNPITNYSSHHIRRFVIPVSISYGDDIKKAIKVIIDSVKNDPAVIKDQKDKEPAVIVGDFADSGITLSALVWTDLSKEGGFIGIKNRLVEEIKNGFDKNGIEIPFPHRVMVTDAKAHKASKPKKKAKK